MNRKAYRMIVLVVCLLSLALSMLACDGGGDSCVDGAGNYIPCSTVENVYDKTGPTDSIKRAVQQANQTVSDDTTWWVNQHSSGSMDCLSVWDQNCK